MPEPTVEEIEAELYDLEALTKEGYKVLQQASRERNPNEIKVMRDSLTEPINQTEHQAQLDTAE
jgi:hypothetical protein